MQTFSNPALAWEKIPRHQHLELQKVNSLYKKIMIIERVVLWFILLVGVAAALYFSTLTGKQWWLLGGGFLLFVLLAMLLFTANKSFENMGYALRKHDFVFRKGWLFEKLHIIPLKKMQHIQIKQGPLERRYGLASLKIFTAGGASAEITLGGLTKLEAEQLKDWLVVTPGESINPKPDEDGITME
jgi:membrane protein YdbS with pleckstrin-like domain